VVEVNASAPPANPQTPIAPVASGSGWVRPMVIVAAFAVVLTLLSTAAVLFVGGRSQAGYAKGTPEAAFQEFISAAKKGDWVTAEGLLSSNLRTEQGMTAQSVAGVAAQGGVSVSIDSTYRSGNRATLSLTYQYETQAGAIVVSGTSNASVEMVLESGGWKVDSPLYFGY
jgi:hypothetical protein